MSTTIHIFAMLAASVAPLLALFWSLMVLDLRVDHLSRFLEKGAKDESTLRAGRQLDRATQGLDGHSTLCFIWAFFLLIAMGVSVFNDQYIQGLACGFWILICLLVGHVTRMFAIKVFAGLPFQQPQGKNHE